MRDCQQLAYPLQVASYMFVGVYDINSTSRRRPMPPDLMDQTDFDTVTL